MIESDNVTDNLVFAVNSLITLYQIRHFYLLAKWRPRCEATCAAPLTSKVPTEVVCYNPYSANNTLSNAGNGVPERMVNIVPQSIGHGNLLGQYIVLSIRYEVSRLLPLGPWHPIVKLNMQILRPWRGFSLHAR